MFIGFKIIVYDWEEGWNLMPKFLMIQLINFADVYKSQSVWNKWMHETVEAWLFLQDI